VNTLSRPRSLAAGAFIYLAGLTPVFAQTPATEAPRGAKLPPPLLANKCYTSSGQSAGVQIESLTQIRTNADVERLRADLINQIWPRGYPTGTSSVAASPATSGKNDPSASGLYLASFTHDRKSNLQSEQRLTITLGEGLVSVVYVWTPRTTNNRLFIVADGHTDSMVNETNYATVNALLGQGFLDHRLVGHLSVQTPGLGIAGARQPLARNVRELLAGHARVGRRQHLDDALLAAAECALEVPGRHGLEGLLALPLGMRGANALMRSSAKANCTYTGCSDQSVPSLSNTAMRSTTGTKRGLPGGVGDELLEGLLGPAVLPARQRIRAGGAGHRGEQQPNSRRKHAQATQFHDSPVLLSSSREWPKHHGILCCLDASLCWRSESLLRSAAPRR
jgi:hypothetical protein